MSSREENKMLFPFINPVALSMAKTPQSFGHSECNRVKWWENLMMYLHTLNLYVTIKVMDKNGLCAIMESFSYALLGTSFWERDK